VVVNAAVNAAVDDKALWETYFKGIGRVCPWSYSAWKRNKIEITLWKGMAQPLGKLEARVNLIGTIKPRLLKKIEQRLNTEREDEEWLHSHPNFGVNSTPFPALIQQDRQHLAQARATLTK
jgi:hypothetical protein